MSPAEPIDCAGALELVDRQLDSELDETGRSLLESHLETCASCHSEAQLALRLTRGLRDLGPRECPDSVIANLMTRLPVSEDPHPHSADIATLPTPADSTPERAQPGRSAVLALAATVLLTLGVSLWLAITTTSSPLSPRVAEPPTDLKPAIDSAVSDSELEQAEREARLAFAYLGAITKRASETLRNDVLSSGASSRAASGRAASARSITDDDEVQQR